MHAASILSLLIIEAGLQVVHSSTDSGPLYLTPYIKKCEYEKARNISIVKLFEEKANATAHSGFITVKEHHGKAAAHSDSIPENKTSESHLFFLYIKAQNSPDTAPLMLWLQGGPGHSSLFGQFLQNGPLAINARGVLYKRNHTIQNEVNILYLDAPVGAGYSFTKSKAAYASNLREVGAQVKLFLKQFLRLFPGLREREFYVAGESYGARFAVALAGNLLKDNKKKIPLKLCGTIGGVGFLGPILDIADSSKFLHEASMVTAEGRDKFSKQFKLMKNFVEARNISVALQLLLTTVLSLSPYRTLFQNLTLYDNHASVLYTKRPPEMMQYFVYANSTAFRQAIHVGSKVELHRANRLLLHSLSADFFTPVSSRVELLLNRSRVLLYTGQMDTLFPSSNLLAYFRKLQWKHMSVYQTAERKVWKPHEGYYGAAGYVTQVHDLTEAVLFGAGHYAAVDKSLEAYYLMKEFIECKYCSTTIETPVNSNITTC